MNAHFKSCFDQNFDSSPSQSIKNCFDDNYLISNLVTTDDKNSFNESNNDELNLIEIEELVNTNKLDYSDYKQLLINIQEYMKTRVYYSNKNKIDYHIANIQKTIIQKMIELVKK